MLWFLDWSYRGRICIGTSVSKFAARRLFLLCLGGSLAAAFVILRAINIYGDPQRWAAQRSSVFTVLSFLNTTKYPPSALLYLLMTPSPALIFLSAVDAARRAAAPVLTIGKVPMFYYLLHVPTIH